jgi:hypothetical protein
MLRPAISLATYVAAGLLVFPTRVPAAGFSPTLAKKNSGGHEVVYPAAGNCSNPLKEADPCIVKVIADAGSYCAYIAGGISKDTNWWQVASIPIMLLSVTGTALGVSSIAAAKSWAAVGGTSGIAAAYSTNASTATATDNQRLMAITTAAQQLAPLDPTKITSLSAALSVATQCRAAAGTSNGK